MLSGLGCFLNCLQFQYPNLSIQHLGILRYVGLDLFHVLVRKQQPIELRWVNWTEKLDPTNNKD